MTLRSACSTEWLLRSATSTDPMPARLVGVAENEGLGSCRLATSSYAQGDCWQFAGSWLCDNMKRDPPQVGESRF
jgi:hypothetical protein